MLVTQTHDGNPTATNTNRAHSSMSACRQSRRWLGPCWARSGAEQRAGHARWIRKNTAEALQGPSWARSQVLLPHNVRLGDLQTR